MVAEDGPKIKKCMQELFSNEAQIDYWETIYARQDFIGTCYRARMHQALSWLDKSSLPTSAVILDAGCGTGILAQRIAERGNRIIGVDYSHGMLAKARNGGNADGKLNTAFVQGDIESLPFRDSTFNMSLCLGVVTYLESCENVLYELSRTLKPGGTLVLSAVNSAHLVKKLDLPIFLWRRFERALNSIIRSGTKKSEITTPAYRKSYLIPKLINSLRKQGLLVSEYTTVPLGLLTFFGRVIPPQKMNMAITISLEKFSNIPLIGSFGGMCMLKARKTTAHEC